MKCKSCKGEGMVEEAHINFNTLSVSEARMVPCHKCKGTGKVKSPKAGR